MSRWLGCLNFLVAALLLTQCRIPLSIPEPEQPIPTIGPLRQGSGGAGSTSVELATDTNCAEIGETIVFTARIANETTAPVTITGTPSIDIVLTPNSTTGPTLRWSESDQYPPVINPLLVPGETRTYEWRWIADARFAADSKLDQRGVWATFTIGRVVETDGGSTPAGGVKLYVGVDTVALARPGSHLRCADMQH